MKTFHAQVTLSDEQIMGIFSMFVDNGRCQPTDDATTVLASYINKETDFIAKTLSERMTAYRISKMSAMAAPITTTVTVTETEAPVAPTTPPETPVVPETPPETPIVPETPPGTPPETPVTP